MKLMTKTVVNAETVKNAIYVVVVSIHITIKDKYNLPLTKY